MDDIDECLTNSGLIGEQRTGRYRVKPVLVPETIQQICVHACLEERVLDFVVLMGMQTEVLELLGGHGRDTSDLLRRFQLLSVVICVGAEDADFYLASRHGHLWVHNDSQGRVLYHLLLLLSLNVNT